MRVADFKSAASAIPPPRLAWFQRVRIVVAEEMLEQPFGEAGCWGNGPASRGNILMARLLYNLSGNRGFLPETGSETAGAIRNDGDRRLLVLCDRL